MSAATPARKGTGIRVIDVDSPEIAWAEYPHALPGDVTPGDVGPGEYGVMYEDDKIKIGVWRRDADVGELAGSGQALDFVVDGRVEVTDADGRTHVAGPGSLLLYTEHDSGSWNQTGPIKKIYVHVKD